MVMSLHGTLCNFLYYSIVVIVRVPIILQERNGLMITQLLALVIVVPPANSYDLQLVLTCCFYSV